MSLMQDAYPGLDKPWELGRVLMLITYQDHKVLRTDVVQFSKCGAELSHVQGFKSLLRNKWCESRLFWLFHLVCLLESSLVGYVSASMHTTAVFTDPPVLDPSR